MLNRCQRAQKQILELVDKQYDLGRLHCVVPNQSTDYVGLTSQVQVQQGNHGPAWLAKKQIFRKVPQGNLTEISDAEVIVPAKDSSRRQRQRPTGAIGIIGK